MRFLSLLILVLAATIAAAQGPQMPHWLFGTISWEGAPSHGVVVRVTNLRTNASEETTTDAAGFWTVDLSVLGYQQGDLIEVRAGEHSLIIHVSGDSAQEVENLSVPPPSNAFPDLGMKLFLGILAIIAIAAVIGIWVMRRVGR